MTYLEWIRKESRRYRGGAHKVDWGALANRPPKLREDFGRRIR